MTGLRDRALGLFLEFRAIPVLLWSFTAIVLGTAVGAADAGRLDPWLFAEALLIGVLIQGYETHAVNDVYDWRSGTDADPSPRVLSGGSRVVGARLLGERGLWAIFVVSSILIWILAADLSLRTGPIVLALTAIGYVAGLLYTLPPLATAYRPFAGEWLGGFVGVLAGGIGGYYVQTLRISALGIAVAAAHALVCVGMLLMHHYLDAPADRNARPAKRTTVVVLGPRIGKAYTAAIASLAVLTGVGLSFLWRPEAAIFVVAAVAGLLAHLATRPEDLASVTRNELTVIQAGIAGGLLLAAWLTPALLLALPVVLVLYAAHVRSALALRTPAAERYKAITPGPGNL